MTAVKSYEELEGELKYAYKAGYSQGVREVIEAIPTNDWIDIKGSDLYKKLKERFLQ